MLDEPCFLGRRTCNYLPIGTMVTSDIGDSLQDTITGYLISKPYAKERVTSLATVFSDYSIVLF